MFSHKMEKDDIYKFHHDIYPKQIAMLILCLFLQFFFSFYSFDLSFRLTDLGKRYFLFGYIVTCKYIIKI